MSMPRRFAHVERQRLVAVASCQSQLAVKLMRLLRRLLALKHPVRLDEL